MRDTKRQLPDVWLTLNLPESCLPQHAVAMVFRILRTRTRRGFPAPHLAFGRALPMPGSDVPVANEGMTWRFSPAETSYETRC